jgi:hypothetical protein
VLSRASRTLRRSPTATTKTAGRISVWPYLVTAFGLAFGVATTGDAQEANPSYRLARAVVEGYKRQAVNYGETEQAAIEKARTDCGLYADQISTALHQGLLDERQACHMEPKCKERKQDEYEQLKKQLFEALKVLCDCTEHVIAVKYDDERFAFAKREHQQEVDSINAKLFQLDAEETAENAFHSLRQTVISSNEDPQRKAALFQSEANRHQQRLAGINENRGKARARVEPNDDKFRRVEENVTQRDLAWTLSGKKCPPSGS